MRIIAVSISSKKGERKTNVPFGELCTNFGLNGDVHADGNHRQLSLLALESIEKVRSIGIDVRPGDFAENITTYGIMLHLLPVGSKLEINGTVLLELTQVGKECHSSCSIKKQAGKCVMPTEGIFCRILKGGIIKPGDEIKIL